MKTQKQRIKIQNQKPLTAAQYIAKLDAGRFQWEVDAIREKRRFLSPLSGNAAIAAGATVGTLAYALLIFNL